CWRRASPSSASWWSSSSSSMRSPDRRPPVAAAERTALAWERSAFAYASLAAVALGAAAHDNEPWLLALAPALVLTAGLARRQAQAERGVGEPRPMELTAIATALTAGVAVVAVLVAR